ncbi:hypothetical protein ES707_00696 [subsurface metagenome]
MSETFRQVVHLLMGLLGAGIVLRLDDRMALVFMSAALVTLGVLDSVSTLAGLQFGRHTLRGKKVA